MPVLQGPGGLLTEAGVKRPRNSGVLQGRAGAELWTPAGSWRLGTPVVHWGRLGLPTEGMEGCGPGCGTGGPGSRVGLGGSALWALLPPTGSAPQAILGGGRWPSPQLARGSPQYPGFRA